MVHRLILFSLAVVLFFTKGNAQGLAGNEPVKPEYVLTGSLKDTVNFISTGFSSITLIRAADSVMQGFTRAGEQGDFRLVIDTPGRYLVIIAHPSFAIFVDAIDIRQPETALGEIIMTSKKQMLDEVVITDARAIVIKNDTIEYAADSFKTRAFDNVDELLKKLPGIEVGRNGKIKAYGQEVKKMTVDGEEFFSDDPAVVAQTLRASAVDKVQVFDKKSDQAAFSGVDDGELTKTINLKLKDNAKQGYFGRISAGAGPPEYWENQAMINAFKGKRKMSVYGIMSNTNTNGLGWDDRGKYGSGNTISSDGNGNYTYEGGDDMGSFDGQYGGQGLPKTWTSGAHYNNKWMGDTLSFSGNYRFGKNISEGFNNSITKYILPDTQYINTNNSSNTSISQNHSLSMNSEYLLDSMSSIKVSFGGRYGINDNETRTKSTSMGVDGAPINDQSNLQQNHAVNKGMNAIAFYRRRFRKKGRTLSATFTGNWSENNTKGLLSSAYDLYAIDSAYSINQRKDNSNATIAGSAKISYTEPISKVVNLEVNYGFNINNNDADNRSYDKKGNGTAPETEDVFNPLYSSHYVFNTQQHQAGTSLRFDFKKIKLNFGGNVSDTRFRQEDKLYDTTYSYSYLNFFPRASLVFSSSQTTSFSIRYNGNTRQPAMNQIQPLRNNTDPLNVAIGNPDLKQEFNHNISLSYNDYKVLSSRGIYLYANLNLVQNAISQRQNVDITGRRTYQYVNVNGNYNASAYFGYGRNVFWDIRTSVGANASYNHSNSYVNGLANVNDQLSLNPNLSFFYSKDTTLDINYTFSPGYTSNASSIRKDVLTHYWTFQQQLEGSINLPFRLRLGTSVDWNIRQRVDPQDKNNNVFRWNAYLSKSFLKDRSLVARLYVNDLLNQNAGYTRNNNADYISESTYNTIRRYFLLSLTWNFTKTGARQPSGMNVIIEEN